MIKRNGKYYLMFSEGRAIDETYRIGYATGDSPFGPFREGKNSPILQTIPNTPTIGPGHHTVFREKDQDYILYHRIYPQNKDYVLRQLCVDSLKFDNEGNILPVMPRGIASFTRWIILLKHCRSWWQVRSKETAWIPNAAFAAFMLQALSGLGLAQTDHCNSTIWFFDWSFGDVAVKMQFRYNEDSSTQFHLSSYLDVLIPLKLFRGSSLSRQDLCGSSAALCKHTLLMMASLLFSTAFLLPKKRPLL